MDNKSDDQLLIMQDTIIASRQDSVEKTEKPTEEEVIAEKTETITEAEGTVTSGRTGTNP